ncbi:putative ammonium transporter sll1017 [Branchiostoma lanceolatum]|uniref:putative ammonium transporter sll1017 n=1 Tax=Branchiostoma lanceolatum TaxID=7740 RepID=UPI00345633D5
MSTTPPTTTPDPTAVALAALDSRVTTLETVHPLSLDTLLLILSGCLIMTMQAGFAMLEIGSIKVRNVNHILLNNVMDVCVGSAAYFFCGYAVSFGPTSSQFLGGDHYALRNFESDDALTWVFFQYSFAATATAIVSGAMVGRTHLIAYMSYAFVITGLIYPTVVHWAWSGEGWLNCETGYAYQDFAGSGVVHLCGGTAALMGAIVLGRRKIVKEDEESIPPSAPALVTLGFFILLVGFFAFNGSSQGAMSSDGDSGAVARAVMNTGLSCSAGGIVSILVVRYVMKEEDSYSTLCLTVNGCLGGTVSICASANVSTTYGALLIGATGALACLGWSDGLKRWTPVQDPVDATAVHAASGLWGLICVCFMDKDNGIFYTSDQPTAWYHLGENMLGAVAIVAYTVATTGILFKGLDLIGILRSEEEVEEHHQAEEEVKEEIKRRASMMPSSRRLSFMPSLGSRSSHITPSIKVLPEESLSPKSEAALPVPAPQTGGQASSDQAPSDQAQSGQAMSAEMPNLRRLPPITDHEQV